MSHEPIEDREEVEVEVPLGIWQACADSYRRALGYPSLWECFKSSFWAGFHEAYNAEVGGKPKSHIATNDNIGGTHQEEMQ